MGVLLQLAPLAAGWAKLAELRRHMEAFAASGKWTVAWMSQVCLAFLLLFCCAMQPHWDAPSHTLGCTSAAAALGKPCMCRAECTTNRDTGAQGTASVMWCWQPGTLCRKHPTKRISLFAAGWREGVLPGVGVQGGLRAAHRRLQPAGLQGRRCNLLRVYTRCDCHHVHTSSV